MKSLSSLLIISLVFSTSNCRRTSFNTLQDEINTVNHSSESPEPSSAYEPSALESSYFTDKELEPPRFYFYSNNVDGLNLLEIEREDLAWIVTAVALAGVSTFGIMHLAPKAKAELYQAKRNLNAAENETLPGVAKTPPAIAKDANPLHTTAKYNFHLNIDGQRIDLPLNQLDYQRLPVAKDINIKQVSNLSEIVRTIKDDEVANIFLKRNDKDTFYRELDEHRSAVRQFHSVELPSGDLMITIKKGDMNPLPIGERTTPVFVLDHRRFLRLSNNDQFRAEDVSKHIYELNRLAPESVYFNPKVLNLDEYKSGTCSAVSFEFLEGFLRRDTTKSLDETFESINSGFHAGPVGRFAERQTAFNTIGVRNGWSKEEIDLYHAEKIQALLNLSSVKLQGNIHVEKFTSEAWRSKSFASSINRLNDGVYVLRGIKPLDNIKLEEHGHTFIFIRQNGQDYLFDPNSGLRRMSSGDSPVLLRQTFDYYHQPWAGLSEFRFYKVDEGMAAVLQYMPISIFDARPVFLTLAA